MEALPSLNALRAFEAVARRGTVKAAAAELHVTPGAVSQQVKGLEQALGLQLFRRVGVSLQLTAEGALLFPVLRTAFEEIGAVLTRLRAREQAGLLTVSVLPSFAAKWLVPRLGRFQLEHPEIDVRISATTELADLARDDVDLAIRLGQGTYPGLRCEPLLREVLFPVCSPALPSAARPLERPEDLRHHALLHDETHEEWRTWLAACGIQGVEARRGPVFNDAAMVLQAAMAGQGVALARAELVAQDLEDGRLMRPFALELPYHLGYHLVMRPAVAEWPKVAAFRAWLHGEAQRYQQQRARVAAPPRAYSG